MNYEGEDREQKVDFSDLAEALRKENYDQVTSILHDLTPRLRKYLYFSLGADEDLANECIQEVYLRIFEKIREEDIEDEKSILKYLLLACRHEYFRLVREDRRFEEITEEQIQDDMDYESQMDRLMNAKRQKILEECMEQLKERYREVITYFFSRDVVHPDDALEEMGLNPGQFRTLKSRALKRLHECFQKKERLAKKNSG